MLRIIVRTVDYGRAANIGGSPVETLKTFDVSAPEVEAFMEEYRADIKKEQEHKRQIWWDRSIAGVEVLDRKEEE